MSDLSKQFHHTAMSALARLSAGTGVPLRLSTPEGVQQATYGAFEEAERSLKGTKSARGSKDRMGWFATYDEQHGLCLCNGTNAARWKSYPFGVLAECLVLLPLLKVDADKRNALHGARTLQAASAGLAALGQGGGEVQTSDDDDPEDYAPEDDGDEDLLEDDEEDGEPQSEAHGGGFRRQGPPPAEEESFSTAPPPREAEESLDAILSGQPAVSEPLLFDPTDAPDMEELLGDLDAEDVGEDELGARIERERAEAQEAKQKRGRAALKQFSTEGTL